MEMPVSKELALSLIVPAYNEAKRLPAYLASVRPYLTRRYGECYETLIVDDGSSDGLAGTVDALARDWPQLCCIHHGENQGKGAAVRTGMLAAAGELLLFTDADGATPIEEEARLAEAIHAGADVAIGSRLAAGDGIRRSRDLFRGLAGRTFAALVTRLLRLPVRDTQCGFKMFRRQVGRRLFSLAQEPRFLFDLEILALAARLGYRIAEVPIRWREIPGGHFHLARELPTLLGELLRLRRRLADVSGPGVPSAEPETSGGRETT
jgi:dolichyl-phosphate beta-glucosyltransferase